MIVDANSLLLGRMATRIAKKALMGETIKVVNCEKAIISGSKDALIEKYMARLQRGEIRVGPFFYRRPDMFVKRAIRGMLPGKRARGREALSRIKCYIGIPEEFKSEKMETITDADYSKLPNYKFMAVGDLCKALGWKG